MLFVLPLMQTSTKRRPLDSDGADDHRATKRSDLLPGMSIYDFHKADRSAGRKKHPNQKIE
jgi:hypothetical protein